MISKIKKWLFHLTRLGVSHVGEGHVDRVLFANIVFICLPIVYSIFIVIDYKSYQIPVEDLHFDQFVVPVVILICFLGLWLNHLGRTILSRVLFLTLWPLLLHIIPIKILEAPSDYYLAFPFGIVFHSMLIQLVFSYKKEFALYSFFLFGNLISMVFSVDILAFYNTNNEIPASMLNDPYFVLDGILYWLLFNLVTFYILFVTDQALLKLGDSKRKIEEQKEALNAMNQTLELQVETRTHELKKKNEQLMSHAYYNAHLLRGPFCRILGLTPLLHKVEEGAEKEQIKEMLDRSLKELDARIIEIQELVEIDEPVSKAEQ